MVFSIRPVAALVVADVCDGREGVGEEKLAHGLVEEAVRLCEEELSCRWVVYEDTVVAGGSQVARGVVFATES